MTGLGSTGPGKPARGACKGNGSALRRGGVLGECASASEVKGDDGGKMMEVAEGIDNDIDGRAEFWYSASITDDRLSSFVWIVSCRWAMLQRCVTPAGRD